MPHAVEGRAIAKPRLGFLGVGLIGYRRLESVVRSGIGEIVAITDTSPRAVERALTLVPSALGCTSLEAMQAAGLDGVVIATPSAQHASESILALRSGLAVFCQKPLGRNAAEVGQIIEAARSHGKLLEVDLCYRYTEAMQKIRPLIRSGALGHIFAVDLTYHNTSGPQSPWFFDPTLSGGGCVLDLGIHLVDAVLWVLDRPIVSVTSRLYHRGRRIHGQMDVAEDYATARLDVAGDTVVNLCCSWRLHAGREALIDMVFYGTEGGVALRNVAGSFHDFVAEQFDRTVHRVLAAPPDEWAGRAVVRWIERLSHGDGYDPEVERLIGATAALDAIYRNASVP